MLLLVQILFFFFLHIQHRADVSAIKLLIELFWGILPTCRCSSVFLFCLWSVQMTKTSKLWQKKIFLSVYSLDICLLSIRHSLFQRLLLSVSPSACQRHGDKKWQPYQSHRTFGVVSLQRWRGSLVISSSLNPGGSSAELSHADLCAFAHRRIWSDESSGSRRWGPDGLRETTRDLWPPSCRFWFPPAQDGSLSLHLTPQLESFWGILQEN